MNTLLIIFHVVVCIIIIFIVLLQVGRGAEAGAAFGGMGQAQSLRGSSTFIGKFTTVMAVGFMLTSLALSYDTSNRSKSSVTEQIRRDQVQTTAPPAEPALPDASEPKKTEGSTEQPTE